MILTLKKYKAAKDDISITPQALKGMDNILYETIH